MLSRIELASAIRVLSMDAVQQAKSGHPGAPMGMADIAQGVIKNSAKRISLYISHSSAHSLAI